VDRLILEAMEKKNLKAIIARAPDFFSEIKAKSLLMNLVYDNLAKGKKALWFCNAKVIHTMGYASDLAKGTELQINQIHTCTNGYASDLAKGTAILGNTDNAYNQIWDLPTDPEKITGEQWINLFAEEMHASNKYQVLPSWGIKMLYQYDRDYYFDSSKFNKTFNYTPTTNKEAVKKTIDRLRNASP